ncbi:MAG: biopolymer transporter ExbD [Bacteroidales bacterium]|jgi:biopolymer transport protein ExbD|nr:biopolymer transporter ExbD [Bacteroidales bacterium]
MAEVQANEKGGGKKTRQKKHTLRVDFTPMVDMNMLLITFFMFCTTMLKPQVMNLSMPTAETNQPVDPVKARESTAITIIMGADDQLFYYEGKLTDASYTDSTFLKPTKYGEEGIRKILMKKNAGTYEQVQELKVKRSAGEIDTKMFDSLSNIIQKRANTELKIAPTVLIKPLDASLYANMVDILDEMLIANIGFYQIADISEGDAFLYYNKTGDDSVLSPAQKAQVASAKKE